MAKTSFINKWIMLLLVAFVFSACIRDEDNSPSTKDSASQVNNQIYALMKEWYYWNDKVPQVNPSKYDNPADLLNALTYKTTDKWSFIMDTVSFIKYFENGEMFGYGMGMQKDANNDLRVTFVFRDSPIAQKNVTRGWKIVQINGKDVQSLMNNNTLSKELGENKAGVQASFQMVDLAGNTQNFTIGKQEINVNTVLHRSVVASTSGKKVGYLVFESFITKSKEELDEAFGYFKSQGVTELVLDLRYNGGGSLQIATHLASLISSSQTITKKFIELSYNAGHQKENKPFNFAFSSNNLSLDRVFIITTKSSASASEAVISGLRPYMPVYTIGDNTHGKPVGMNVFTVGKYAVAPITFKVINSLGEGEYFNGINADVYAQDNINYDFGDKREDCLKQALYFVENGTFESPTLRTKIPAPDSRLELEGFRAHVGAF